MAKINSAGYLYKRTNRKVDRDWWLIKASKPQRTGIVSLTDVRFPFHLVGKKVKFKIEVIEDANENEND